MEYSKKVVVIKQVEQGFNTANHTANGIARLESENGVCDLHLTTINLAPIYDGDFWFFLVDCAGELYSFELGKRPISYSTTVLPYPNITNGFSCGLCFIKDNLPTMICFGKTDQSPIDLASLKKRIAEKCLSDFKTSQKQKEEDIEQLLPAPPPLCDTSIAYDDEAVATENYFETEEKIKINLERIKEYSRERIFDENELPYCTKQTQKEQSQTHAYSCENETNFTTCQKEPNYFDSVKEELFNLFDKFESYDKLACVFPKSQWAKVNYSKDKFYVVGLIKENDREKYICYGVPTENSKTPPKQLQGFCSFVALENCNDYNGFWMMFQDAQDGKCVKSIN